MPQQTITFRVLIASPGDVSATCDSIIEAIHIWNSSNTERLSIVFQPVRWLVDSMPELGTDPQSILNKQLVEKCDVLICVFWTRLGSPTPRAISGTVEEIAQFVDSGRHAMIYFSQKNIPIHVDTNQLDALREFKASIKQKGIIYDFDSHEGLVLQLQLHLGRLADRLQADQRGETTIESPEKEQTLEIQPILDRVHTESSVLSGAENVVDEECSIEDEDLGILDYSEVAEKAMESLVAVINQIRQDSEAIGTQIEAHSQRISDLTAAKGSGIPPTESKRLINAAATDLERYGNQLRANTPQIGTLFARVAASVQAILSLLTGAQLNEDRKQELSDLESVTSSLPDELEKMRSYLEEFRNSISSMPKMTSKLNRARKVTVEELTKLENELVTMVRLSQELSEAVVHVLNDNNGKSNGNT